MKYERLKDIKTENMIWVIYIVIIIMSWYANSKEKNISYITMKRIEKNIKS